MTPAGLAVIDAAKADGSWTLLAAVEDLVVPDDLAAALSAAPPAVRNREALPRRVVAAMAQTTPTAGPNPPRIVVPTAVRVEAGWSRRSRRAAAANRFRVDDEPLVQAAVDDAADIRVAQNLSVADAHLAAVLWAGRGPFAVLTSEVDDVRRIAAHLDVDVTVVAL